MTPAPKPDPTYRFQFPDAEKLPPPVLAFEDVAFSYSGEKADYLYQNLNFGVDLDSRIALVGPNGAGKSTIISMLTGLITKSEGEASIYNTDLFEDMDQVREFMGICPQHDVLFDLLTPREHLEIFYDFKGGDPAKKTQEIESLIADVGLTIDQNK